MFGVKKGSEDASMFVSQLAFGSTAGGREMPLPKHCDMPRLCNRLVACKR